MLPFSNSPLFRAWCRVGFCATLFLCIAVPALLSHDPITTKLTWTQEISRVVYKRCASCHRPGGQAFSLLTYDEARPWAKAIRDQVRSRSMPPWGPVKGIGEFKNDPSLSEPEIDLLVTWVEGGAPLGDLVYLPKAPEPVKPAVAPHFAREMRISDMWAPKVRSSVAAIQVSAATEAWVTRKDGAIERLLWIRGVDQLAPRQYVFRQPVTLDVGDRLRVTAPVVLRFP